MCLCKLLPPCVPPIFVCPSFTHPHHFSSPWHSVYFSPCQQICPFPVCMPVLVRPLISSHLPSFHFPHVVSLAVNMPLFLRLFASHLISTRGMHPPKSRSCNIWRHCSLCPSSPCLPPSLLPLSLCVPASQHTHTQPPVCNYFPSHVSYFSSSLGPSLPLLFSPLPAGLHPALQGPERSCCAEMSL